MDLINTRYSIWNFTISIQYLNMQVDEEPSSAHENGGKMELLRWWASFKKVQLKEVPGFIDMVYIQSGSF